MLPEGRGETNGSEDRLMPTCEECFFYKGEDGTCHRYPPAPVAQTWRDNWGGERLVAITEWPQPGPGQWCGEWKSKYEEVE